MTWDRILILLASLFFVACPRWALAQQVNLESPIGFFTNVASRLLRSELGVDLNRIQIYPTNQYTPSVHRLLQVAANVYDAATNRAFNIPDATNGFPSVFRPVFFDEQSVGSGSSVWIVGYSEVTNIDVRLVSTNLATMAPFHDLNDPNDRPVSPTDMVYGVPLIIGAKKGFPNFNEFGLLQDIHVARNLIFHRVGTTLNTNQIYTMGISNVFSVEAWNSYSTPYPRPLEIVAVVDVITKVTNELGQVCRDMNGNFLSTTFSVPMITNVVASAWRGFVSPQSRQSFIFPLGTRAYLFLTNSDYSFNQNRFVQPGAIPTDPQNLFPIPGWKAMLRSRVRFALWDLDAGRIVDYVNISEQQDPMDIAQLMQGNDNGGNATCDGNFNSEMGSFFCTNRTDASLSPTVATWGIINQFGVSMGIIQVSDAFWRNFNAQMSDRLASIDKFRNRILGTDTTTDFAAPFVPSRVIHQSISWQANDPVVHYVVGDLHTGIREISYNVEGGNTIDPTNNPLIGFPTLPGAPGSGSPLNQHYRPWGGNPLKIGDSSPPTSKNLALKDSQVTGSDAWNFPTNGYPNLDWLGQVHRGTPWQTLFLKATNTDLMTWQFWTGVTNVNEAQLTMPTNDWHVVNLIISMLSTNDPHHLFSLNQPNADAWRTVLDGLTVLTNTGTSQFDTLVMSSNSPQAATIASALDTARASQPERYFRNVGDLLATPDLTTASPWLNLTNPAQSGITDEGYEKIPSQLLPLLRPDSVASIALKADTLHVEFSGIDGYAYGVQVSSNLSDWTTIATNYPKDGLFDFTNSAAQRFSPRFYRSRLLP